MTTMTLSLIAAIATMNSPFIKPKEFSIVPQLEIDHEISSTFYVKGIIGARTQPKSLTLWNPVTGKWTVEAGIRLWDTEIGIGHQSEHGIGNHFRKERYTETFDYIKLQYKKEF